MITPRFVVSRRVLGCDAVRELLRVHMSQIFGIDFRSPRVKFRAISRKPSDDPAEALINFTVTVWYPGSGDVRKTGHYRFVADPKDGLFFGLQTLDIE